MTDRSEQIDSILAAAVELTDASDRLEYIQSACAGDDELVHQVTELVAAYLSAGDFLESPAEVLAPTIDFAVEESPGTHIGRYKLLQQVGEGGFAVVFMAEQERPVRRRVALKIIKPGMNSRQVIARFEAERQALAMMDHSNIAKVLDAGTTESGRPYFAMELVKGTPITGYSDEHCLSIDERLALFSQVCDAVQHAHQKGIIHRDIKPSNVLVSTQDDRPLAKVIDFGIAKATECRLTDMTLFTDFRQLIGTPAYMSPEQAEGSLDIDTRSDVYSLGVLLYELLSGAPPFDPKDLVHKAIVEMQRLIREVEPPAPSARLSTLDANTREMKASARKSDPERLAQRLRGELDWIVLRAMEKDRNRRYRSAAALADDLERYVTNQPVEARPITRGYRFRKFARRNKGLLLIASVTFAAMFVLVAGLAVSNRIIVKERNQKSAALEAAEIQRQRAEENFRRARIAISDILTDPTVSGTEWSQLPRPLRKMAIKYYKSLLQTSDDASARYETAVGYRSLSSMYQDMEEYEESEKHVRQSIAILEKLTHEQPDDLKYQQQLGWSYFVLAWTLRKTNGLAESQSALQKAVNLYEQLISREPGENDYQKELLKVYTGLGDVMLNQEQLIEAEQAFRQSLVICEKIWHAPTMDANDDTLHAEYPKSCSGLAAVLIRTGRTKEASKWLARAVELNKKAVELVPGNGMVWYALGRDQYRAGEPKAAFEALAKSLELRNTAGNAFDCFYMAMCHWQLGDKAEADKWYRKAVASMDEKQPNNEELVRLRSEASELLGMQNLGASADSSAQAPTAK